MKQCCLSSRASITSQVVTKMCYIYVLSAQALIKGDGGQWWDGGGWDWARRGASLGRVQLEAGVFLWGLKLDSLWE